MTFQEYWDQVQSSAEDAVVEAFESYTGENRRREAVYERLWEDAESMCIYYSDAADVCQHTDNCRAIYEEMGPQEFDSPEDHNTKVGIWACRADMAELIEGIVDEAYEGDWYLDLDAQEDEDEEDN